MKKSIIRYSYACLAQDGLCNHPKGSYVRNSGHFCTNENRSTTPYTTIWVNKMDKWMFWVQGMSVLSEWKSTSPLSFFNGFREIRKSSSWKTGVDMSTRVHPVATPLTKLCEVFRKWQTNSPDIWVSRFGYWFKYLMVSRSSGLSTTGEALNFKQ